MFLLLAFLHAEIVGCSDLDKEGVWSPGEHCQGSHLPHTRGQQAGRALGMGWSSNHVIEAMGCTCFHHCPILSAHRVFNMNLNFYR